MITGPFDPPQKQGFLGGVKKSRFFCQFFLHKDENFFGWYFDHITLSKKFFLLGNQKWQNYCLLKNNKSGKKSQNLLVFHIKHVFFSVFGYIEKKFFFQFLFWYKFLIKKFFLLGNQKWQKYLLLKKNKFRQKIVNVVAFSCKSQIFLSFLVILWKKIFFHYLIWYRFLVKKFFWYLTKYDKNI